MGFWDDITGKTAADAAKAAAADTYAKQQAAGTALRGAGDQYATSFADLAKGYQPWQGTGLAANDAVQRLMSDPSSVRSLPAYQFMLGEGQKAIDRSAVSNGNLFSGKTGKALVSYGENLADKTYGDQLSRLLGISQQGLGATQAGINTTGTGLTGQLGTRTSAYNGDMTSAGTIGQGDIAAANAKTAGMQNLLNFGGQLLGSAASFGSGGGGFGGGGFGGLLGGSGGKKGLGSLFMGGGSPSGY
ncbi:hypothetical protein QIH93_15065 [Bradyrhizobium ottawaense]|uniref:hypothetical protein n=1 Tax=Bradyrhizobium ottawaense TaxID=931866 RepID=UPI002714F326|nr:hypothetical protein [Bradyrhizobium ottawaense]WLB49233.1 hypothetical protein QIH93_15065 [Bradyrhizobium ottawaense]